MSVLIPSNRNGFLSQRKEKPRLYLVASGVEMEPSTALIGFTFASNEKKILFYPAGFGATDWMGVTGGEARSSFCVEPCKKRASKHIRTVRFSSTMR